MFCSEQGQQGKNLFSAFFHFTWSFLSWALFSAPVLCGFEVWELIEGKCKRAEQHPAEMKKSIYFFVSLNKCYETYQNIVPFICVDILIDLNFFREI